MKKSALVTSLLLAPLMAGANESAIHKVIGLFSANKKVEAGSPDQRKLFCLEDEKSVFEIEDQLLSPVGRSVLMGGAPALGELSNLKLTGFTLASSPFRNVDGIVETKWAKTMTGTLADQLKGFQKVEFLEMKTVDYSIDPKDRDAKNMPQQISLRVQLDVRGTNASGKRRQDKGILRFLVTKKMNKWSLAEGAVLEGKTLVLNRQPAFKEITQTAGLNGATTYRRTEAIRRGGYALSVTDINNDGLQDLYIGMKGGAEVWYGQKDGSFKKAEGLPFENEKYSKTAVFADFNNDGTQDVVIARYLSEEKTRVPAVDVVMYENRKDQFVLKKDAFGKSDINREPMPIAVADFNNDGLLDFYVGYPGTQDFSQLGPLTPAKGKRVQGLYLNDGKGGFKDMTESNMDYANASNFYGHLFPHSAMAVDFDQDQHMDLIVMDDRGNLSPAFSNQGGGKLVESSNKFGIKNNGYAMSLNAGDTNNDGLVDLVYSNVNLSEIQRADSACERHYSENFRRIDPGLRIFNAAKKGGFDDVTKTALEDGPGEATGGMTFIDYNNDGLQDIYLVNGLWSGTPDGQDFGSFFNWALIRGKEGLMYSTRSSDTVHFMDILSSFKGTIADYTRSDSIKKGEMRPSLGGFQRNRLFRNNGDGTYTDVGYLEGADSMADGYIVAKADLNGDGKMDLILRNADPGTDDYKFPVVQAFQNAHPTAGKSVVLKLVGRASNGEGLGAFAKAYIGNKVQVQHLIGNSGSAQEQRLLHFGLGKNKKISKLEIFWPAGGKETLYNIEPGLRTIRESALKLSELSDKGNTTP